MANESGPDGPLPGDDLLDRLKSTAAERERRASSRRTRNLRLLGGGVLAAVVVAATATGILRVTVRTHTTSLHLPARVGDLARMDSAVLAKQMEQELHNVEAQDSSVKQAAGAFYSNDPTQPQVVLIIFDEPHNGDVTAGIRAGFEAPIFNSHPTTPDGPHTVSATVNGVDFVCEPVIEHGDNGPLEDRTDCTWDDHGDGIGLLIDFFSGESSVVLKEVEAVQPGAIR